jgi:acetyl/propionyl-CoA carboxylase alpha subunit
MTLYHVTVGSREYQVDVTAEQVTVDGKPMDAQLLPLNAGGLYLLQRGEKQRELHVDAYGRSRFAVMVGGRHIVALVEKGSSRARKEGDPVEKGQVLVVLESMKMQMEFRAPASGKVVRLMVQTGMHVEKGALLVEVGD